MQVEMSLAEMLMNAIVAGRVHGFQCKRSFGLKPDDEKKAFDDFSRVIADRLDAARKIAWDQGYSDGRQEWERRAKRRDESK